MAELDLESLAIKELIAEIEKRKRQGLPSGLPPQRQVRPNKRFLGRTIISVLQHNRRQSREEKQNSFKKLDELNRRRHTSRSREVETTSVRRCSPRRHDLDDYERQIRLEMCFLGTADDLTADAQEIPKEEKRKKSELLTIDLTKKKKKSAKEKKKIKSKKRRRRKDSTSSSSSDSSSSSNGGTNSSSPLEDMHDVRDSTKPKKKHAIRKKKIKSKKRRRRKKSNRSSSGSSSPDSGTSSSSILEDIGNVEHSPKLTIDLT